MTLELHCCHCAQSFIASSDSAAAEVLDRVAVLGPWQALGDGETLEDRLYTALTDTDAIACPECGQACSVSEASLSECARELLLQW